MNVSQLKWTDIKENALTTRLVQSKTGFLVVLTLHPIAQKILEGQRNKADIVGAQPKFIFALPTANGANKILGLWAADAGIEKKDNLVMCKVIFFCSVTK